MLKNNPRRTNRIFLKFVASYIAILFITISIGSLTYSEVLSVIKKNAIEDGLLSLDKGKDAVDARFMEIDKMITQLTLEEDFVGVSNIQAPIENSDVYKLGKLFNKLPSYNLSNNFIDNFYIYFKNSDVIMSPRAISFKVNDFYDNFLNYKDMDFQRWYKEIFDRYNYRSILPEHNVYDGKSNKSIITYVQSTPISYFNNYKGAAIVLIDKNKIDENFDIYGMKKDGWMYILDSKDNIISSTNISGSFPFSSQFMVRGNNGFYQQKINGNNMIIIYTVSEYSGLKYIMGLPASAFSQKLIGIKKLFALTDIIILITGIIAALFLAYRNSIPIKRIIKKAIGIKDNNFNKNCNDYDLIEGTILNLIKNKTELSEELSRQTTVLKAVFWERLLKGGFNSIKELEAGLSYLGIRNTEESFIVIIMGIIGFNNEKSENTICEIDAARIIANNIMEKSIKNIGYLNNIDNDRTSILLYIGDKTEIQVEEYTEKMLSQITDELYENYNTRVCFGIGNKYTSLFDVSNSYYEAIRALEYKQTEVKTVIWFKNIPPKSRAYFYPQELEVKLINLIKMGQANDVLSELKSLYDNNIVEGSLMKNEYKQFIYELRGTILKVRESILVEEDKVPMEIASMIKKIDSKDNIEEQFVNITIICKYYCSVVNERKKSHNVNLKRNIMEYIDLNYLEYNLCLSNVASQFDLAENYLSNFFKEQTGECFSAYIEKIRLQHAVDLLAHKELSISDIIKKVGYTNSNTFYKAFKRIYGVSPSLFRKKLENIK